MLTLAFGYHEDRTPTHGYARGRDGGVREEVGGGNQRRGASRAGNSATVASPGPAPKAIIALSSGWLAIPAAVDYPQVLQWAVATAARPPPPAISIARASFS